MNTQRLGKGADRVGSARFCVNSPRTDYPSRGSPWKSNFFLKKKKRFCVGPWRSSRRLLLSSGFSVTVCVATLSERLLLEGGAWTPPPRYTYVHVYLSFSPFVRSAGEILKKGSASINFIAIAETWILRGWPSRDAPVCGERNNVIYSFAAQLSKVLHLGRFSFLNKRIILTWKNNT